MINPKPKPPLPGGEHVQVIDTGPQLVRPGVPTVNLIPVGDGGPGPLLPRVIKRKKRKPLLPSEAEIAKLPRWARVAFAARCVQRCARAVEGHNALLADLVATSGQTVALAAEDHRVAGEAAARAAEAILRVTSDPRDLLFIRRDFDRFRWLAKTHQWTDDTPVPPEVIGPLWPPGRVPHWAKEKKKPRG